MKGASGAGKPEKSRKAGEDSGKKYAGRGGKPQKEGFKPSLSFNKKSPMIRKPGFAVKERNLENPRQISRSRPEMKVKNFHPENPLSKNQAMDIPPRNKADFTEISRQRHANPLGKKVLMKMAPSG